MERGRGKWMLPVLRDAIDLLLVAGGGAAADLHAHAILLHYTSLVSAQGKDRVEAKPLVIRRGSNVRVKLVDETATASGEGICKLAGCSRRVSATNLSALPSLPHREPSSYCTLAACFK